MSEILKIKDFNKGAILKQGDTTTLKYYLYDADEEQIESIIGSTAEVVFLKGGQVHYRTTGEINDLFICEFKIEEVLPTGVYHIEFIVNGHIFPSTDRPYFTITASSKGNDINIIKVNGFEELVVRSVSEVEGRLEPFVDELEANELTRTTNEASRIADENTRKANEIQRNDKQIRLRNLIVNGDFSNGNIGWAPFTYMVDSEKFGNGVMMAKNLVATTQSAVQNVSGKTTDKFYVSFKHYLESFTSGINRFTVRDYSSVNNATIVEIDTTRLKSWQTSSVMVSKVGGISLQIQSLNTVTEIYYDDILAINLTETFGAGNEPTKEQMDELIAITGYISGERVVSHKEMFKLIGARAKKKQEDWITPTLLNGAVNYPQEKHRPLRYRLNEFGETQISGTISPVPSGTHIFTLPVGFRGSDGNFTIPLITTSGTNRAMSIEVNNTDGVVKVFGVATAYINFNVTLLS